MIPSVKSTMSIEEIIDGQISHNQSIEIRLGSKYNTAPSRSKNPLSSPRTDVKISSSYNSNTNGSYSNFSSQNGLHEASFMPSNLVFIRRLKKSDLTNDGNDDDDDLVSSDDSSTTRKINRKRRDILRKVQAQEEKTKKGTTTHTSEIHNGLSLQRFYVSPFICEGMIIYLHRHEESCVSSIGSCGDDEFSLCNDQSFFEPDESENYIKPI